MHRFPNPLRRTAPRSSARANRWRRAFFQLGKGLGMQVMAEGLETVGQGALSLSEGCPEGQGYHYSKPLPGRGLGAYLKQAQRRNAAIL